ncbi:hypothetical protein LTR78_006916 [Recurvomyces mirabilis]|uniref:Major facilitator superfamily (MFS) profile domain-containing protein n=1 Tax=Recurvomyces mirabilis TaxID=574656 RepID=A0AAE0WJW7_9PEZI|nr:hypothetical protein LTR78_006916 [Recurvomyces mirabilis]KAK5153300.1 hypothetical protein LTS14_007469 [Recurvomyces mirabilis]
MLLLGGAWFIACTIVNGFVPGFIAFNILRALSGIGGAFILPNGVAMIGITNPPGSGRNVSYGFFGASAPIGGYLGGVLVGVFIEYYKMEWCFLLLALFTAAVLLPLWWLLPPESPVDKGGAVDWLGAVLGTSALILFNFVWNQAPAVGWQYPYEIGGLVLSLALLAAFVLWERFVDSPIMPPHIFNKQLGVLLFVVLLNYMCIGTTIWYGLSWLQIVRGQSVLTSALGFSPFVVCGTFAAVFAGWLVPRLAAQWVLAIGAASAASAALLIATMPVQETYWAQVFPAWILMAFSPDLVYTAAQIIASNSVGRSEQGVAGSLIGTLNLFGCSLGLGFASTIETQVNRSRTNRVLGYRSALWFGFAIAINALLLDVLFVRRAKDDREGWDDDLDTDLVHHANDVDGANATGVEVISLDARSEQEV